jgi:phosphopantothenoylcysteine synthetase/decarboxylase
MTGASRVAYVIACSAPPVLDLPRFLRLLKDHDWDPYVILTPTAAMWVDVGKLAVVSGHEVRIEPRTPADPDSLPPAAAVIAAPLTFNTLNKWAAGISDILALGLLNETLGLGLPITAAPCIKEALRGHPAYARSVATLSAAGVGVLDPERVIVPIPNSSPTLDWSRVLPR